MQLGNQRSSGNVEDRRGIGMGGGLGIGGVVLAIIAAFMGIDPSVVLDTAQQMAPPQQAAPRKDGPPDEMQVFVSKVLGSTEDVWQAEFKQMNRPYHDPKLVLFTGSTRSACGVGQAAMGPFYCPNDRKVYLDTSFFQDLERRFRGCEVGSKGCQFSQAYVITHEIGHHVQNLLGILPKVQEMQRGLDQAEANQLQVRVELQADCLAGVWAHHAEEKWRLIEPGDVEAAMQTASAIGDDRLQRRSQGYVVPDAFTHGSSAQRTRWFLAGLKSGELASCDTFSAQEL